MTERRTACTEHKTRTADLEKIVFKGNGTPSLVSSVATINVTNKIILGLQTLTIAAIIKMLFFGG